MLLLAAKEAFNFERCFRAAPLKGHIMIHQDRKFAQRLIKSFGRLIANSKVSVP